MERGERQRRKLVAESREGKKRKGDRKGRGQAGGMAQKF